MTRFEQIQETYKGIYGAIDLYIDATQFFFIDIDQDRMEGYKTITSRCGCCSEQIDIDSDLSYELEYMDEYDFQDLIEELEKLKKS